MANEVVRYDSDETGAPTLNNAAGSMIAVLDACLITGFRVQTLTGISVTSSVATCTLAGHGYGDGRLVDISGSTPSGLNGRKRITVTGTDTFTFAAPGVSDGAATGTITAKRSPLGWAKTAGTNKAIYSRTDVAALAQSLRVDDSAGGLSAAVVSVEAFTSVDTYTAPAPTVAMSATGQPWGKGANTGAAKRWLLIGDSRSIWLFVDGDGGTWASNSAFGHAHAFGDLASYRAGDAYSTFLAGNGIGLISVTQGSAPSQIGCVLQRHSNQVGAAVYAGLHHFSSNIPGFSGSGYPSEVDNGLAIQYPVIMVQASVAGGHPPRGAIPGLAFPVAALKNLAPLVVFPNVAGRDYVAVPIYSGGNIGCVMIDLTGPWQ